MSTGCRESGEGPNQTKQNKIKENQTKSDEEEQEVVVGDEVDASVVTVRETDPTSPVEAAGRLYGSQDVSQLCFRGVIGGIREFCHLCKMYVFVDGHYMRCRVPVDPSVVELYRKRAWFGDSWQLYHVRWLLIRANVPVKTLQSSVEKFVGAVGQAAWYDAYFGKKLVALGTSFHSISTAFEASYFLLEDFRESYIRYIASELTYVFDKGELDYLVHLFQFASYLDQLGEVESDDFFGVRLL